VSVPVDSIGGERGGKEKKWRKLPSHAPDEITYRPEKRKKERGDEKRRYLSGKKKREKKRGGRERNAISKEKKRKKGMRKIASPVYSEGMDRTLALPSWGKGKGKKRGEKKRRKKKERRKMSRTLFLTMWVYPFSPPPLWVCW